MSMTTIFGTLKGNKRKAMQKEFPSCQILRPSNCILFSGNLNDIQKSVLVAATIDFNFNVLSFKFLSQTVQCQCFLFAIPPSAQTLRFLGMLTQTPFTQILTNFRIDKNFHRSAFCSHETQGTMQAFDIIPNRSKFFTGTVHFNTNLC